MRRFPAARLTAAALVAACSGTEPSNAGPTAAFTAQCPTLECTFTNTSTDFDGSIEAYDWDFGDRGPHATTRDAVHRYASAGRFVVKLTVTDDGGSTSSASYQVDVKAPNAAPTARFIVSCAWLSCEFTSQSFDGNPGGSLASYAWDFGDESPPATTPHAVHTYGMAARYAIRLVVWDNQGAIGVATQELDLSDPNLPPEASFAFTCTDLTCRFSDQSFDGEGSVVAHVWGFGDGQVSSERNPEHTFPSPGTYPVRLTVTDDRGATGSLTMEVIVPPPPPAAYITYGCDSLTCSFFGESYGNPGEQYRWDFGDGETSSEQYPQHTFGTPGSYTVGLTVTDHLGQTGYASVQVTVPPPGPSAAFTVACDVLTCTFTNRSTGVWLEAAYWEFGDGTTSSEWHPTHTYAVTEPTTFTVRLTVYDWYYASSVSHEVAVTPAGSVTMRATAP
jgi:PKD repeat protein